MELKPPTSFIEYLARFRKRVFLAGSIEQGRARPWHGEIIKRAGAPEDVLFLNPRRAQWDASWKQEITDPMFKGQVDWELDGIDYADTVFFYFEPGTKAPVTMLELGIALASGKECIVCCPTGFWRKGNVDITCARYATTVYDTFEGGAAALKLALRS